MSVAVMCCGSVLVLVAVIYLPMLLLRLGFTLLVGCVTNGCVLVLAALLLVLYLSIVDIRLCDSWLVGDFVCALWMNRAG
ncbi:MAG: hypothetical protein AAFN11_17545 [Chloroflexota bacterium]